MGYVEENLMAGEQVTHRTMLHWTIFVSLKAILTLFIAPLVALLLAVSDRRLLGQLGRWNRSNSPWIKAGLALAVLAMSFGLLVTM